MAKQQATYDPSVKHMQVYQGFVGMNTSDNEVSMRDQEMVDLVNMDLDKRGSLRRRTGIRAHKRRGIWNDIKGMNWGDLNG